MKPSEVKTVADALRELNEDYITLIRSIKETSKEAKATKRLWRDGHNPMLIKLGLALIAFPDPTISDVVGSILVAAGTVQEGVRRRTLYIEDIHKTFQDALKELRVVKNGP